MTEKYPGEIQRLLLLSNWQNLSEEERDLVYDIGRRQKKFSFSKRNIAKLRKLNDILHEKETAIYAQLKVIHDTQTEWEQNGEINDYKIDSSIALWNKKFDKLHPDLEGNPFFEFLLPHFEGKRKDNSELYTKDNWNDCGSCPGHQLANDRHCYTFHHLYDHTPLNWHDLVAVDEVWIEINVRNQFMVEIK